MDLQLLLPKNNAPSYIPEASAAKPVHCVRRAGARVSATLQTNERFAAATGDSGEPTGKVTAWLTAAAA